MSLPQRLPHAQHQPHARGDAGSDPGARTSATVPLAGALDALASALTRIDDHQHAISCEIAYVTHLVQEHLYA
jgi:hypothetical protein